MSTGRLVSLAILIWGLAGLAKAEVRFSGERKLNNLVAELLEVASISNSGASFPFTRPREGWIFVSSTCRGTVRIFLDEQPEPILIHAGESGPRAEEAMRHVSQGKHTLRAEGAGEFTVDKLIVRSIPELIHCGLGFDPQIKSYGVYDMEFLEADILPNVNTLIIPSSLKPSERVIEEWHRQGKKFIAEVGIDGRAKTAEDHLRYWSGFYDKMPFLDGIIIDEFIVNRPFSEWAPRMTRQRLERIQRERRQYQAYGEAFRMLRADSRYTNKMLYAYVGGSGKKLNREVIGADFIPTIVQCGYRVALERYLHEMSSPEGSRNALELFLDGIADWEAKEPAVRRQMVIAFGLFSMPPGGLNKQPKVDYHVWMDQQMNLAANAPALSGIAGLDWWTSSLADEETVRFVGRLYRHYAIEGQTGLLTKDPLFLDHLQNPDFEDGTNGWTLQPAEAGSIAAKRFPRYGRIEGRFMGLGRPADPEHIGDTFLWMKRSEKGPNRFSQTIKDLEPGRLYSLKMFCCNYDDLVHPRPRKVAETESIARVMIDGAEVKRSFSEVYASSPEPKIPVCITYYWKVFRAKSPTAMLTVSDWREGANPPFGQEQAFNFLEIQPYHP